jgi:hypothetical protein
VLRGVWTTQCSELVKAGVVGWRVRCRKTAFTLVFADDVQRFYTNPVDVPELNSFVLDVLQSSPSKIDIATWLPKHSREPDGFENLPTELLDLICSYLPTESVIKLHRTSRTFAMKLPLDNAFWRNCLLTSSLHSHTWGLDIEAIDTLRYKSRTAVGPAEWDWQGVAKLLSTKQFPTTPRDQRLNALPLGFWNRCRIWSIFEKALALDNVELGMKPRSDSGVGSTER